MINQKTAMDIALAYREIDTAEKLLAEISETLDRQRDGVPDVRDAFGRLQNGLQLGVPSGRDGHRLFNVPWTLSRPILQAHIAQQRAQIAALCQQARGELDGTAPPAPFDLVAHLQRQRDFSLKTFGPGPRTKGVVDHIRKELAEIEADPADIMEWVDVIILAFDGAWRAGWEPQAIVDAIVAKQTKNEARQWPDWRTADPDKAIEHVRAEGGEPHA